MLILQGYQIHLLVLGSVVDSLGFSKSIFMLATDIDFLIFFPICMTFISFSCLIAPAVSSITMLNKSGECGHPDNRGKAISLTIECKVSCSSGDFL